MYNVPQPINSPFQCECNNNYINNDLVSEREIQVLEVTITSVCCPLLIHRGLAVPAAHIQNKLTMLVGALVSDDVRRNVHTEGKEATSARPYFTMLKQMQL